MHSQFASQPEFRERFLQEAKALPVGHPSIVHIYDFGSLQGLLYIVIAFGATLSTTSQAGEQERRGPSQGLWWSWLRLRMPGVCSP
jgi:hypothetical protein